MCAHHIVTGAALLLLIGVAAALPSATQQTPDTSLGGLQEEARAIVDVQMDGPSGGVSYIIHPDNLPPPEFRPLKDLPPPKYPVAQWRPDIFMKVCCSDSDDTEVIPDPNKNDTDASSVPLEVKSGYAKVGTSAATSTEAPSSTTASITTVNNDDVRDDNGEHDSDSEHDGDSEHGGEHDSDRSSGSDFPVDSVGNGTGISAQVPGVQDDTQVITEVPEKAEDGGNSTQQSSEEGGGESELPTSSLLTANHTARYEESGSTYQGVANFLKDIASSDGFQNAFLGDLIKNFGSLDHNALKLIYSLLIGPLERGQTQRQSQVSRDDRLVGDRQPSRPNRLPHSSDQIVLDRDKLPLRDRPANGYQPFKNLPPGLHSPGPHRPPLRPSLLMKQEAQTPDESWRPGRVSRRRPAVNRVGDHAVDVITAPPFKNFEVVLGSSLNHNKKQSSGNSQSLVPLPPGSPQLPFDKLTLGMEMPPPEALEALPPGSVLIPPSHIMTRPKMPKLVNKQPSSHNVDLPLADFLPNLPFFNKPSRFRPPQQPQAQDIPPRLPGFLSAVLPDAPPPRPFRPPNAVMQPPRRIDSLPSQPQTRIPTGPPPIVTKFTPPFMPTVPVSQQPHHQPSGPVQMPPLHPVPPPPPFHASVDPPSHSLVPPPDINPSPANPEENVKMKDGATEEGFVADRIEDYPAGHTHLDHNNDYPEPSADYDAQIPSDYYIPEDYVHYYDADYSYYYEEPTLEEDIQDQEDLTEDGNHFKQDAGATFYVVEEEPPAVPPTHTVDPSLPENSNDQMEEDDIVHHEFSEDSEIPSLDDLLGVIKPNVSLIKKKEPEMGTEWLHNHRISTNVNKDNGTINNHLPEREDPNILQNSEVTTASPIDTVTHQQDIRLQDPVVDQNFSNHMPGPIDQKPEVLQSEHDTSVSHLWKNLQLVPLAPEIFDGQHQGSEKDSFNLTNLFTGAVPLSPVADLDNIPGFDINERDEVHISVSKEIPEGGEDPADAKFMAYALIGACCGLALLSITGVIVIVRFKKTCGSRQIKTRTRLADHDSVESISRRVDNLTLGSESGHKLGSWFTGRNEQLGTGKLRSNMALPTVHDHKREKGGRTGSTRDLLSISSESSCASTPHQQHREVDCGTRTEDEEPRASWLHDEFKGSHSNPTEQDLAYLPHQYQQPRQAGHHSRYQSDQPSERGGRERRHTGSSRAEAELLQHGDERRGGRYLSCVDSEELEERLVNRDPRYITDSELEDGITTQYEDESREPSRYFSDSRELDDVMDSRRGESGAMTSQELGDHLSRDLKHYQTRQAAHCSQQDSQEQCHPESSLQELDGDEGSRELGRCQSQVSFSRDNVQNEVFLELDSILRQAGHYMGGDLPASTLGRASRGTDNTNLSVSRANTPDSIDLQQDYRTYPDSEVPVGSPPTTPPRFTPPPAPPRPPKPGHLSQPGTPSPRAGRARPHSPEEAPPSPPRSSQRPVYWGNEDERLI